MALVPVKALVLVQLSVLLVHCFAVLGDEVDMVSLAESPHQHAPSYSPAEAPKHHKGHHPHHHKSHPPSQPPVHPPSQPPSYHPLPKRSLVAVQGVVYCKPCKYSGVNTLLGATPLLGAVVKLECNNTMKPLVQEAKADKNGYFMIMAPKNVTTFGSHKCKVALASSPMATCSKPTSLNGGDLGATLMPQKPPASPPHQLQYELFTVGPFAFEPAHKC